MSRLDIKASYLTQPVKQWIGDLLFPNAFEEEWDELFDNEYSGSVFKTKYLSFYNESMLRVEREPLHHCNQGYAA